MSINGVLEDLPLADVLQFIHLGRRTGTLYMWRGEEDRAEIGFHDGRIVAAWTPHQRRLGDLLLDKGLIDDTTLQAVLFTQRTEKKGRSLGHLLLDRGAVEQTDVYGVVRDQIQSTIFELVHWRHGYFQFEVDELRPLDDFGVSPEELLKNLDLNTQMLVLEATRLFDEEHREPAPRQEPNDDTQSKLSRLEERLERAGLGRAGSPVGGHGAEGAAPWTGDGPDNGRLPRRATPRIVIRCQVVSDDPGLAKTLDQGLPTEQARVVGVPLRDAGTRMPGESVPPLVVLDLRSGELGADAVASLARTRPAAPTVALVASQEGEERAYEAGALAVVTPGHASVVDCCRNLIRVLTHPQPHGSFAFRGGADHFRRVVFDVQSGLSSATMALNLMHLISDSVERAVLFLVQEDELRTVGAFGFAMDGPPLAERTRRLHLRPANGSAFAQVLENGEPQIVDFDDADLPAELAELVGRPASGQVVLFPVLGAEKAISLIYTDNGAREEEIEDVRILELATSQVGMAFENELLRHKMADVDFDDL